MLDEATLSELVERVVSRLSERLAAPGAGANRLLTKRDAAAYFAVAPAQLDRWVREGMPRQVIGASPRFELEACKAWLAEHAKPRLTPVTRPAKVNAGVTLLSRPKKGA